MWGNIWCEYIKVFSRLAFPKFGWSGSSKTRYKPPGNLFKYSFIQGGKYYMCIDTHTYLGRQLLCLELAQKKNYIKTLLHVGVGFLGSVSFPSVLLLSLWVAFQLVIMFCKIALLALALIPSSLAQINEGFESGWDQAAWPTYAPDCSQGGKVSLDTANAHSGKNSMRVDGGGGYCGHIFFGTTKIPAGDVYVRAFM
jgi:hypothetical protein